MLNTSPAPIDSGMTLDVPRRPLYRNIENNIQPPSVEEQPKELDQDEMNLEDITPTIAASPVNTNASVAHSYQITLAPVRDEQGHIIRHDLALRENKAPIVAKEVNTVIPTRRSHRVAGRKRTTSSKTKTNNSRKSTSAKSAKQTFDHTFETQPSAETPVKIQGSQIVPEAARISGMTSEDPVENFDENEQKIVNATIEAFKKGSLSPLIKEELRCTIQSRRLAMGKGELKVEFKSPPKKKVMDDEERKRAGKRKIQNREAAQRFRQKQKDTGDYLTAKIHKLQKNSEILISDLDSLRKEKEELQEMLRAHLNVCTQPQLGQAEVGANFFSQIMSPDTESSHIHHDNHVCNNTNAHTSSDIFQLQYLNESTCSEDQYLEQSNTSENQYLDDSNTSVQQNYLNDSNISEHEYLEESSASEQRTYFNNCAPSDVFQNVHHSGTMVIDIDPDAELSQMLENSHGFYYAEGDPIVHVGDRSKVNSECINHDGLSNGSSDYTSQVDNGSSKVISDFPQENVYYSDMAPEVGYEEVVMDTIDMELEKHRLDSCSSVDTHSTYDSYASDSQKLNESMPDYCQGSLSESTFDVRKSISSAYSRVHMDSVSSEAFEVRYMDPDFLMPGEESP